MWVSKIVLQIFRTDDQRFSIELLHSTRKISTGYQLVGNSSLERNLPFCPIQFREWCDCLPIILLLGFDR